MKEIKPLTSLRAFAAFLVFMFHYAFVYHPHNRGVEFGWEWIPLMPIWEQGRIGVSMFFVLSGFLITRIYYDGLVERSRSLRLFFVKRIARIWPLFVVYAVIQHLFIDLHLPWAFVHESGLSPLLPSDHLVTMTMTQGFFSDLRYSGLPTAWSLTVEETFYASAPLFYLFIGLIVAQARRTTTLLDGDFTRRLILALVILGVGLALMGEVGGILVRKLDLTWKGFMGSRFHVWHLTLFGRFPEFAIGMFCAFVHRDGRHVRWLGSGRADVAVLTCTSGIALLLLMKNLLVPGGAEVTPVAGGQAMVYLISYLIALMTGGLILSLTVEGTVAHRLLSARILVFLGKISYGFYLVQVTAMIAPFVALTDHLGPARIPVLFVLTNGFCAMSYWLVESPARKAIVARWGQKRAP